MVVWMPCRCCISESRVSRDRIPQDFPEFRHEYCNAHVKVTYAIMSFKIRPCTVMNAKTSCFLLCNYVYNTLWGLFFSQLHYKAGLSLLRSGDGLWWNQGLWEQTLTWWKLSSSFCNANFFKILLAYLVFCSLVDIKKVYILIPKLWLISRIFFPSIFILNN